MESIKNIFKIGYGPSSSHTMGPEFAAIKFLNRTQDATNYEVELFGSLALTGKGHLTDEIIYKILGKEKTKIKFNLDIFYEYHSNAMKFSAYRNNEKIDEWLVFSVGGGEIRELNEPRDKYKEEIYHEKNIDEIIKYCSKNNLTFLEYIISHEKNILNDLEIVYNQMEKSINEGLSKEDTLPGKLKLKRKATTFYKQYLKDNNIKSLIFAYTLAVAEQNASGGKIVTAPTCGASGVLPGLLFAYQKYYNIDKIKIIEAIAVAGLIGNVVKTNASISGAEVGCQGEVGVACAMAAGAMCYLQGGNNNYIEYAAEIALEHHLGMTCDPVLGMVQIPCIERNAMSAEFAFSASQYALFTDGSHHITLDSVIEVMNETGKDLHTKYKETSIGGLALRMKEHN